jgi:hypothetical protein
MVPTGLLCPDGQVNQDTFRDSQGRFRWQAELSIPNVAAAADVAMAVDLVLQAEQLSI